MKTRGEEYMNNKKKGFTLVELIVVLAILAILAAMLVPALTGYIDKANEKKLTSVTRQVVVAAQTVISEKYAQNPDFVANSLWVGPSIGESNSFNFSEDTENHINMGEICELAEITDNITKVEKEYTDTSSKGQNNTYIGYEFMGKLTNNISWIIIQYDNNGKVFSVEINDGNKTCAYDGTTGEYTIN